MSVTCPLPSRVAEFCSYIPKGETIENLVNYIYSTVEVKDENGMDMIISIVVIRDTDYYC